MLDMCNERATGLCSMKDLDRLGEELPTDNLSLKDSTVLQVSDILVVCEPFLSVLENTNNMLTLSNYINPKSTHGIIHTRQMVL